MKKILFFLIITVFIMQVHSQGDPFSEIITAHINKTISMLGGAIPEGFQRLDRTMFRNNEDIILMVENGIVTMSSFGDIFTTTGEAHLFTGLLFEHFENNRNNWVHFRSNRNGTEIYQKADVYAGILKPAKRDDGMIVSVISFSKNNSIF